MLTIIKLTVCQVSNFFLLFTAVRVYAFHQQAANHALLTCPGTMRAVQATDRGSEKNQDGP